MKNFSSALMGLLVLGAPFTVAAQNGQAASRPLQANEHALNLPGATTIEAPPAGFDPTAASDAELAYYGYPPRPNQNSDAKAFATWTKAMKHSQNRMTPVLQQTAVFHGPAQLNKNAKPAAAENNPSLAQQPSNTLYSSNWGGYVDFSGASSYGSSSYYYLVNDMVVPIAQQSGCSGGWEYGSGWNGIDGWGSGDVLQAGVEFDAYCSGSTRSSYYSAWYEWYPYGEVRISSLPVTAGDEMFVEVWHTSATQGYAYLVNDNTDQYVEIGFTAPPGTSLIGNSAEWVVEAPTVGGSIATITDYTAMPFWYGYAYTEGYSFYDIATADPIDEEVGSSIVSYPDYLGTESFVMVYQ